MKQVFLFAACALIAAPAAAQKATAGSERMRLADALAEERPTQAPPTTKTCNNGDVIDGADQCEEERLPPAPRSLANAHSEDQRPSPVEQAKTFLARSLPSGVYLGASYYEKLDVLRSQDKRMGWKVNRPEILRSINLSNCVNHIWVGPMKMDAYVNNYSRNGVIILNPSDFDLPWGELISVRSEGQEVKLLWKGSNHESAIRYGNDDSAARVANAIAVLRQACAASG